MAVAVLYSRHINLLLANSTGLQCLHSKSFLLADLLRTSHTRQKWKSIGCHRQHKSRNMSGWLDCLVQGAKAEVKQWSTFLASLQAGQNISPQRRAADSAVLEWAGSVHWNNVWDKAVSCEAKKQQEMQEAAVLGSAEGASKAAPAAASGVYGMLMCF